MVVNQQRAGRTKVEVGRLGLKVEEASQNSRGSAEPLSELIQCPPPSTVHTPPPRLHSEWTVDTQAPGGKPLPSRAVPSGQPLFSERDKRRALSGKRPFQMNPSGLL